MKEHHLPHLATHYSRMSYSFVYDEDEARRFVEAVYDPDDGDPVVMFVSVRNKYGAANCHRKATCFSRAAVSPSGSPSGMMRQIRRYEAASGAYTDRNGEPVDQQHMVIYTTVNTRSRRKTREAIHRTLVDLSYNPPDVEPKIDGLALSVMMKPENGNKRWVTIDIDDPSRAGAVRELLLKHDVPAAYTVVTRGGFHVLIDLKDMTGPTKKNLFKHVAAGMKKIGDTVSTDMPCPVPGTLQAGHRVTMVRGFPEFPK